MRNVQEDEDQDEDRVQGHSNRSQQPSAEDQRKTLADVATLITFKKENLTADLHHQPKVAEHRGSQQRARNRLSVLSVFQESRHGGLSDAVHKAIRSTSGSKKSQIRFKSASSVHRSGKDDRSSGSFESVSVRSGTIKSEEDDAWNLYLDESLLGDDDGSPLFEMADVDIEVEQVFSQMQEALRCSSEQGRVTERERTVVMDKFGLFLQALVSYQENEVELIDSIGMKNQACRRHAQKTIDPTLSVGLWTFFRIISIKLQRSVTLKISEITLSTEIQKPDFFNTIDNRDTTSIITDVLKTFAAEDEKPTTPKGETKGDLDTSSLLKLPDDDETEAGAVPVVETIDEMNAMTVRKNLLVQKNKLEIQEQMRIIHVLEIKQLEFEKTLLTMHYAKMIKPADLQKEIRDLRKTITDMKIGIATMQQEVAQLQLDITAEGKSLREEESEVSQLDLETLSKQIEVSQNSGKPIHLQKDADREAHKLEQLQDVLQDLDGRWMAGMRTYRIFQIKIDQKSAEYSGLLKEEGRMNQARKQAQQETERVLADTENLQKREQALMNKCRIVIDKILYNIRLKKKLFDHHHSVYNESTRAQREYQKLERSIKLAREGHLNAKLAHEKMRSAFDAMQPKGDSENWAKLRIMFVNEIETLKVALEKSLTDATIQASTVSDLQTKLNQIYEEQMQYGKELQDLMRTTVRKRRERQDKAEQCIKLDAQLTGIANEIRLKKILLEDCSRNERDLNRSITLVQKKYSQVKIQKAAVTGDLIQAKQRLTEQMEKFKIANNQVESYVNQSLDRQREVTRLHYLLLNAGLARDSVRNDALRSVQSYRGYRIERNELKLSNENIRKEIVRLRRDVTDIRKRFEDSILIIAKVAIQVRERTEEVCTFVERIQAYDMILFKATAELRLRELEKIKLESTLNEIKTHLVIITTNEPNQDLYIEQVESLRQQFFEITKERRELEGDLSNITKPGRVRELNHHWIPQREGESILRDKINNLESLLAKRDIRILERNLSLKQVQELTEDGMEKANCLKTRYECDIKYLVEMRKTIYHLSSRIDGLICETALALTRAETAETKYRTLKQDYESALRRFHLGLPPSRELVNIWNHKLWQQEMLMRANSGTTGFLVNKVHPTGAGVVMERFRTKSKCRKAETGSLSELPALGPCGPKFPYKPKGRKRVKGRYCC